MYMSWHIINTFDKIRTEALLFQVLINLKQGVNFLYK